MTWRVVIILLVVACSTNQAERSQQIAERRQTRDAVLLAPVVESAKTPTSVGRLIYERPADLSYDSMRVKRPDLLSRNR
jgi:hypothetical protein